jgi:hypothetical protein
MAVDLTQQSNNNNRNEIEEFTNELLEEQNDNVELNEFAEALSQKKDNNEELIELVQEMSQENVGLQEIKEFRQELEQQSEVNTIDSAKEISETLRARKFFNVNTSNVFFDNNDKENEFDDSTIDEEEISTSNKDDLYNYNTLNLTKTIKINMKHY